MIKEMVELPREVRLSLVNLIIIRTKVELRNLRSIIQIKFHKLHKIMREIISISHKIMDHNKVTASKSH